MAVAGSGVSAVGTAVAPDNSDFQSRNSTEISPRGLGYEYLVDSDLPGKAPMWANEAVQEAALRALGHALHI